MELFENYIDDIDGIIKKKKTASFKKFDNSTKYLREQNEVGVYNERGQLNARPIENTPKVLAKFDHSLMAQLFGVHKYSVSQPIIGDHPDFKYIQQNEYENHYAVSLFLDIKGSTSLSKKYDLLQVRLIKDTILTLAIHVCSFFGGHIQRLQGDGVFVYFVRREQHPNDALINSLNASSMMCFFMNYVMNKYFKKEGIDPLKVRIGIDYGDNENVLWSRYGLSFCNELTTTSLHTDLASKLQSEANSNGIMLGHNIVEKLDIRENLIINNIQDPYIFDDYKKYDFKWEDYLRTFDFIKWNPNRELMLEIPQFRLLCSIAEKDSINFKTYPQNLFSIPKDYKIKFELQKSGSQYHKTPTEKIEWKIKNTGKEALLKHEESPDISKFNDTSEASVTAAYLGHHDMECKIIRAHSDNLNVKHSVFVQGDN
ncbi:MAG: hypothetical protein LLG13_02175 [Bacteroidales bacterium]|nr:hypothetical protein [Bacteroidales bacterium]